MSLNQYKRLLILRIELQHRCTSFRLLLHIPYLGFRIKIPLLKELEFLSSHHPHVLIRVGIIKVIAGLVPDSVHSFNLDFRFGWYFLELSVEKIRFETLN